jgi:hypothetical protein
MTRPYVLLLSCALGCGFVGDGSGSDDDSNGPRRLRRQGVTQIEPCENDECPMGTICFDGCQVLCVDDADCPEGVCVDGLCGEPDPGGCGNSDCG